MGLTKRLGGKAFTGGNIKFSDDFLKKLPGMDDKWDAGPKGSQNMKEMFNLPKAQQKKLLESLKIAKKKDDEEKKKRRGRTT